MSDSFGFQLNQFAQAIDIMDKDTFSHVADSVEGYVGDVLKADFFAVRIGGARAETDLGSVSALQSVPQLSRAAPSTIMPLRDSEGNYRGQCEFAFGQGKNLWILKSDQSPLNGDTGTCTNAWEGCEELPPYRSNGVFEDIRTSIVCPLGYRGESMDFMVMGVMAIEFKDYLTASPRAKEDIRLLADALARMVWLRETSSAQNQDRKDAFRSLTKRLSRCHSKLRRPKVFIATGSKACKVVVRCIRDVVKEYDDKIEEIYWEEVHDAGNISVNTLKSIAACEFGICYFSEKLKDRRKYSDNPNVVFEAGMLHAFTNDPQAAPQGWIPVREDESMTTRAPFDFAAERMIVVKRNAKKTLDGEELKAELRRRIETMLRDSQIMQE